MRADSSGSSRTSRLQKSSFLGNVMIQSIGSHARDFRVTNYCSDTTRVSSTNDYKAKKHHWLSMNADTLRNLVRPGFKGLK